jgi:excinuclease ABC subunit A
MTELTDYFKVWFSHVAALHDPETGEVITLDTPQSIWKKARAILRDKTVLMTFSVQRAGKLDWTTILSSLSGQGYTRAILENTVVRLDELQTGELAANAVLQIVQDRITLGSSSRARFIEAATAALHFGKGNLSLHDTAGSRLQAFSEGLHRPGSQRRFQPASPNLFSFNSPIGACPSCRGFGRVIEIDDNLIIPDHSLTLREGAIKAFSGAVYSESQRDLLRACKRKRIPTATPWKDLSAQHREFVLEGDPDYAEGGGSPRLWYGVRRFFGWLESNTYKMHVRVFLSRYRSYVSCPDCGGARLQKESLCWQWQGHTLPDLYRMPVSRLLEVMRGSSGGSGEPQAELALDAIRTRLGYLEAVGLGYLTLDRASRTLSGGETQRVLMARTLAASPEILMLDEPLSGVDSHQKDHIKTLLRQLNRTGQTIIHVTHDFEEAFSLANKMGIMHAGKLIDSGKPADILKNPANNFTARFCGYKNYFDVKHQDQDFLILQNEIRLRFDRENNASFTAILIKENMIKVSAGSSAFGRGENILTGILKDYAQSVNGTELIVDAGLVFHVTLTSGIPEGLKLHPGVELFIQIPQQAIHPVSR